MDIYNSKVIWLRNNFKIIYDHISKMHHQLSNFYIQVPKPLNDSKRSSEIPKSWARLTSPRICICSSHISAYTSSRRNHAFPARMHEPCEPVTHTRSSETHSTQSSRLILQIRGRLPAAHGCSRQVMIEGLCEEACELQMSSRQASICMAAQGAMESNV